MWQFFGRKEILSELKFLLEFEEKPEERSFSAILILGRRGVGKTELLSQIEQRVPSNLPYVYVELPDPDKIPDSGDVTIDLLIKEASRSGLDIANLLPERGPYDSTTIWFGEILAALLRMGAIVVLDEFHHSGNPKLGFVSQIKLKIDIARGGRGDWGRLYPGKVVMMGSHQQNVRQLFKSTEPLFQRQDVTLRLRQWTLPTIMEMANQQGILIDPKKFLILWAAYGGMPHHWHRYCTSKKYSHLHEMSDIKEWRSAFLTAEKITLESNSEERFDTKAYMEFPDIQRGILLHIGRNKPQGDQLRGFSSNLRDKATLDRALDQLLDLELIDIKTPFYADGPERWCISDNNALFQIMVFREIIKLKGATKRDENPTPPDMDTLVRRMETLEGGVMERMAETWLKTQDKCYLV